MRMVHRAGLFIPNNAFYIFQNGLINGITWTGTASGYSNYSITDKIMAGGYIWSGVTGSGSSSVITYVDLRGFKHIHFAYDVIKVAGGECPNIRVYPNYVSLTSEGEGPWEAVYDLDAIPDLSNQLIMIQSGHINKDTSSGVVDSEVDVTAVWATRD